jgi:outer membrane protein
MNILKALIPAAALGLAFAATGAQAEEFQPKAAGTWMVNLRATDVSPDEDAPILAAGVPTGLKAEVSSDVMPTLGIAYFFTDNIAAELILGTTQHQVKAVGGATNVKVHKTWVLPPVLSVQYHFNPAGRVSPYVGAGLNYMLFYSGDDQNGFNVKLDDGVGYSLQAGVDVALKGKYSLNVDVKKVFFETDATINGGALTSKVDLDPWVVSVGVGYKF